MKRRVIQLAGKTLVVSLPSRWAKLHGIKKGDELEITEKSNSVICSIEKRQFHETITVDVTGLTKMVKRIIASLYKAGFDELRIKYSNSGELRKVQEVLSDTCMGFEIISKKEGLLTIKNISRIDENQYDTLLRRSWLTLLEMSNELESAFKAGDPDGYESVIVSDMTLNRFTDFCRRTLNTGGYVSRNPLPEYVILEGVEKIGDAYRDLARIFEAEKMKRDPETAKMIGKTNKILRDFYELFYNFSYEGLTRFRESYDHLCKEHDRLFSKSDKKKIRALASLQFISAMIFDLNGPLIARNADSDQS